MSELKPCPFCGHEAIDDWGDSSWSGFNRWRYCPECQAQGPHMHSRRGEGSDECQARADEAWNTRVDFAAEREQLAEAEARGYRRALEDAAVACEVEADKCDDAAKWGESRQYVADCKAASYAMRDRAYAIRKMGEKG